MRITKVRTRLLRFDATARHNGHPAPPGRPNHYEYPLIELEADDGTVGYSMGYGPHGEGPAIAALVHDVFAGELLGADPRLTERLWQTLYRKNRHLYSLSDGLVGMLDVAVWDLAGKAAGIPIARMLGQYRDSIDCYQTSWLTSATGAEIAEEVARAKSAGYHGYKLQLRDGFDRDAPRFVAAREAAGDGFPLMQDAAAGYSFGEALRVGRLLTELDYTWFEEPIEDRQLSRLRQLTKAIGVSTLAGETVSLAELSELLQSGAARIVRGDVYLKAGISGLSKAVRAAELLGYNLEIHTANAPLLDVANLHVAAAARNSRWIEVHHPVFRFGLLNDPLTPDAAGRVAVPDRPGLGVELDWAWVDDHTISRRETVSAQQP